MSPTANRIRIAVAAAQTVTVELRDDAGAAEDFSSALAATVVILERLGADALILKTGDDVTIDGGTITFSLTADEAVNLIGGRTYLMQIGFEFSNGASISEVIYVDATSNMIGGGVPVPQVVSTNRYRIARFTLTHELLPSDPGAGSGSPKQYKITDFPIEEGAMIVTAGIRLIEPFVPKQGDDPIGPVQADIGIFIGDYFLPFYFDAAAEYQVILDLSGTAGDHFWCAPEFLYTTPPSNTPVISAPFAPNYWNGDSAYIGVEVDDHEPGEGSFEVWFAWIDAPPAATPTLEAVD